MDHQQPRHRMERNQLCPLRLNTNNNSSTTNSGNNVHASNCKPTYHLIRHQEPHNSAIRQGPYTYYECQAAIIGAATPVPFPGHTHGDVFRKAALFMELIEQYQLPELTITLTKGHTITIERTHQCDNQPSSVTSSQHWHTNSPHHGEQSTPALFEPGNGKNTAPTTSANTAENTH